MIIENFAWMSFNLALALLGAAFGGLYYHARPLFLNIILGFLWIIFLPNTFYVYTDLEHLLKQLTAADILTLPIIICQYLILVLSGIYLYFLAMYPIKKLSKQLNITGSTSKTALAIILNIAIAIAMVMGKFPRTHSWYIFTQPQRVTSDILLVLSSDKLFMLVLINTVIVNTVYFLLQNKFASINQKVYDQNI